MPQSNIQWTQHTLNVITGCTKVSEGCRHCYAHTMHTRLTAMRANGYAQPFHTITTLPERLAIPYKRRKPTTYFINSMSDTFHQEVPNPFLIDVLTMMRECPQHRFILLTKRSQRMNQFFVENTVSQNVLLGVTVENRKGLDRIVDLQRINAPTRFLSIEPLLEDLGELDLTGIHWVIVGGESGTHARPMHQAWVESIYSQCQRESVPFFFKQWGGRIKNDVLNGQIIHEFPRILHSIFE